MMMADVMALTAEDPENHGHHAHHHLHWYCPVQERRGVFVASRQQQAIYSLAPSRISKEYCAAFHQLHGMEILIIVYLDLYACSMLWVLAHKITGECMYREEKKDLHFCLARTISACMGETGLFLLKV